ncbi:hypothetical protein PHLGIDRAFT_34968, partial [Phlebiopsis gigantea 11061_1 CR5-6]
MEFCWLSRYGCFEEDTERAAARATRTPFRANGFVAFNSLVFEVLAHIDGVTTPSDTARFASSAGLHAHTVASSLHHPLPQTLVSDVYSDSRTHGPQGPTRHVRMQAAATAGGGSISKNEDGSRCVVAGRESLRILRVCDPNTPSNAEHKHTFGHGGYRIDASRNLWSGSGLKIDSVSTDVVWAHGAFNNKVITSARNGEIIMWDIQKSGPSKFERRTRQHVRSIHKLAYSSILHYYCITASADGDIRVWDLRDLTDSIMKIHHPASVRSVVFSPIHWQPRHAITGLDNGNIYRWDLNMGQRGQLDRIALAHSGPVLTLDWTLPTTYASNNGHRSAGSSGSSQGSNWYQGMGSGFFDELSGSSTAPSAENDVNGNGWLASGGLDRTVKVWDITVCGGGTHISRKPIYTLHTSFPVRRVAWRPNYECELAVTSYHEGSANSQPNPALDLSTAAPASPRLGVSVPTEVKQEENKVLYSRMGDPIEVWDVRRGYIAKWSIRGSAVEGGVTDVAFADSHTIWAQHFSGTFSQLDLRTSTRPVDAIPRTAVSWDAQGCLLFVADRPKRWEVPYDDVHPDKKATVKRKPKALGDKVYLPSSQTMCMVTGYELGGDTETIARLAQSYRFDGSDRPAICAQNADAALDAGKPDAAQTWLLLESLLIDMVQQPPLSASPTSNLSPLPLVSPRLPHSTSAPAAIPTVSQVLANHPLRSVSADGPGPHDDMAPRPNTTVTSRRSSAKSRTYSSSTQSLSSADKGYLSPLRTTPVSSTTPSPHRPTTPLPSTPISMTNTSVARRTSGGRLSVTPGNAGPPPARPRLGSSYRRSSFATTGLYSGALDGEIRSQSHPSLKHVGEGVLEDTDSDDSASDKGIDKGIVDDKISDGGDEHEPHEGETEQYAIAGPSRAAGYWNQRSASVQPSPLSRVAGQQTWSENEKDEEDSPSPASTDNSDSSPDDYDDVPPFRAQPRGRGSTNRSRRSSNRSARTRTRSRSSTVASLAVSTSPAPTPTRAKLMKQGSQSSVRTVTASATPTSMNAPDSLDQGSSLQRNDTARRISGSSKYPASVASGVLRQEGASLRSSSAMSSNRPRSGVFYEDDGYNGDQELNESKIELGRERSDNPYKYAVKESEARLRDVGWQALRETLEVLADEGDVQMCAMLALVVPDELKLGPKRALRFIESYVEILMRLRLHVAAAYIRKCTRAEDVQNQTAVHTIIHTRCTRCNKSLLHPHHTDPRNKPTGGFSYCADCR